MATLTINNVPPAVIDKLRLEAARRAKSLDEIAAERLAADPNPAAYSWRSAEELLAIADRARVQGENEWLTPGFIRAAREDGRA